MARLLHSLRKDILCGFLPAQAAIRTIYIVCYENVARTAGRPTGARQTWPKPNLATRSKCSGHDTIGPAKNPGR